jgi:polygalacturonase
LHRITLGTLLSLSVLGSALLAQDTRKVIEPALPKSCTVLTAALASKGGQLSEADETKLDTARLQKALDKCAKGQAVELAPATAANAFLSAPFSIPAGVTLLVDKGVTLFASRNPKDYDDGSGMCGTVDDKGKACKNWISVDAHDSAIMGGGILDARGGSKILGKEETWWQIARRAQKEDARQNCFRMIYANKADGFILYRITLKNSPNFHVVVAHTDGFTAWGVKIDTPADARNTDGIDPSGSKNVTITHSYIRTGDDNIAMKAGGSGPIQNISIVHNNFYYGHGMSIGSETFAGVNNILVEDLSLDGTTAGIRIKSDTTRGGLVENILYKNICMRSTKNPIEITPFYEGKKGGEKFPTFRRIFLEGVHSLTPGKLTFAALDAEHAFSVVLNGVQIDGQKPTDIRAQFGQVFVGPGKTNLSISGSGITQSDIKEASTSVPECKADRFPEFPVTQ